MDDLKTQNTAWNGPQYYLEISPRWDPSHKFDGSLGWVQEKHTFRRKAVQVVKKKKWHGNRKAVKSVVQVFV